MFSHKPSESGRIEAIWIKRARGAPMDAAPVAELVAGAGLVGNANQGGKRQVTIIELEVWEHLMSALGAQAPTSTRRANLVVRRFSLHGSRGRRLRVGSTLLKINGETKPCEQMERAVSGLREAMFPDWRGGAYAEVIEGGRIEVGDEVSWESEQG